MSISHPVNYVLHYGVNLRLLVWVPLRTCIGGVAKCVGDVAMCVGDHVKGFYFSMFFNTGWGPYVQKQHRNGKILQIVCFKMLND